MSDVLATQLTQGAIASAANKLNREISIPPRCYEFNSSLGGKKGHIPANPRVIADK